MIAKSSMPVVLAAACLLCGCKSERETRPAPRPPAAPAKEDQPARPPAATEPVEPPAAAVTEPDAALPAEPARPGLDDSPGVIKGVVRWAGPAPRRKKIDTAPDPQCGILRGGAALLSDRLVINPNSTVKDVFVYVSSGLPASRTWPAPDGPVVLDQVGCHYEPHVFGVRAGQDVVIRNSDDTAHNINARPQHNTPFNRGQPKKGMEFKVTFDNAEMMVPFKCDVHPWMNAFGAVMEHPFFAVSDATGAFTISGLPPGRYELSTWIEHPRLSAQTRTVVVGPGADTAVEFAYKRP